MKGIKGIKKLPSSIALRAILFVFAACSVPACCYSNIVNQLEEKRLNSDDVSKASREKQGKKEFDTIRSNDAKVALSANSQKRVESNEQHNKARLAAIKKSEPQHGAKSRNVCYNNSCFSATINTNEKNTIDYIITNLGDKSLFSLLCSRSKLEKRGEEIKKVPTLDFLAFIFSNKKLKRKMESVRSSYFKWDNFIKSVAKGMDEAKAKNAVFPRLEEFAQVTQSEYALLRKAAAKGDWDQFVDVLFLGPANQKG